MLADVGGGADGGGRANLFVLSIFAWALLNFGNVYYGSAQRAFDIAVERVKTKTWLAMSRPMSYQAEVQHGVAWPSKLVVAEHHAVEGTFRVVDGALDLSGGFGVFKGSELERLFRDARLGRIHPGHEALTVEFAAKTALGIDPD